MTVLLASALVHGETRYEVPRLSSAFRPTPQTRGAAYVLDERPLSTAGGANLRVVRRALGSGPKYTQQPFTHEGWSLALEVRGSDVFHVSELVAQLLSVRPEKLTGALWYAPQFSGNHQYIAFLSDAPELTGAPAAEPALYRLGWNTRRLELVSAVPGNDQRAVRIGARVRRPSISHDGRYLAFQVVSKAGTNVYVRDMAELGARALCEAGAGCSNPVIAADGRRLAFVTRKSLVPEDRDHLPDVYTTALDGQAAELVSRRAQGGARRSVQTLADEPLAISGDGRSVAFTADGSVWLARGGELVSMSRVLAAGGAPVPTKQPAMDLGRSLAFVARRVGDRFQRVHVYSFDSGKVDSPEPNQPEGDVYYPALRPTSDKLHFVDCQNSSTKFGAKPSPNCTHDSFYYWSNHPEDRPAP